MVCSKSSTLDVCVQRRPSTAIKRVHERNKLLPSFIISYIAPDVPAWRYRTRIKWMGTIPDNGSQRLYHTLFRPSAPVEL